MIGKIKELNVKEPYMVEVKWKDAHGIAEWITDVIDWVNSIRVYANDIGWLLHKDSDCIVIASGRMQFDDGTTHWSGLTFIPSGFLVKISRLGKERLGKDLQSKKGSKVKRAEEPEVKENKL